MRDLYKLKKYDFANCFSFFAYSLNKYVFIKDMFFAIAKYYL